MSITLLCFIVLLFCYYLNLNSKMNISCLKIYKNIPKYKNN